MAVVLTTPVMLLIQHLGPGGSERQMFEIAANLDRARFTPHVCCLRTDGFMDRRLAERGVPVLRLPLQSFLSAEALGAAWELGRYLRRNRIRIAHAFDNPMACFGVPVARAAGVPVVLSSQRGHRDIWNLSRRRWLRLSDRLAHGIVVNCEFVARHLREDEGVPANHIYICYNGIDGVVFKPRARGGPGRSVIGVVAVLRPEKGLETLIEAFAEVRRVRRDARLIITGGGPELGRLEARARELGLGDSCCFEPATSDVPGALAALDIFVLPSRNEAFSNSLMEAMAAGLCVIGSNVGGNPELITDGLTGLLFEVGDAAGLARQILRVLDDDALRARLGEAASRHVREDLSIEASVGRMQEIYDGFLNRIPKSC
jgi:glycosyltransferase involved in cell wall biosynthesis